MNQQVTVLTNNCFSLNYFFFLPTGNAYKGKNKEIADLQNQIQNLIKLAQQAN